MMFNSLKYIVLLILSTSLQASPVQKIISLNLCADIILLQLADESQQLSTTYLIEDMRPYVTIPETIEFNRGLTEEIIVFQPDVIFAHTFTSTVTLQRLEQLGWPIVKLKSAQTFDDIFQNITQIGQAIQQQAKAQQMVKQMQQALQAMPKLNQQKVLVFYPNGFSVGKQTLADHVLSHLHLHNVAEQMGIIFWGKVSLEQILQYQPEFIILSAYHTENQALATKLLNHRILQKIPHLKLDNRLWQCGNVLTLQAMQYVVQRIKNVP